MAAKGGCIDLMFLVPSYPATGSATGICLQNVTRFRIESETNTPNGKY